MSSSTLTSLGIIAGVLALDYIIAQNVKPRIVGVDSLPMGYNAMTLPPFGIYVRRDQAANIKLLRHEVKHWEQYRQTGLILFGIRYGLQRLVHGYDKMPLEIEARHHAGETHPCTEDYTNCVRTGTAATIHNPKFRS